MDIHLTEEEKKIASQKVYDTLCKALENEGWTYYKHPEDLAVNFGIHCDGANIHYIIKPDVESEMLIFFADFGVVAKEDKRIEFAIATLALGKGFSHGKFNYDIETGKLMLYNATSYYRRELTEEHIRIIIHGMYAFINENAKKLIALNNGETDINEFLKVT